MNKVRVLQLGPEDFVQRMPDPKWADWHYEPDFSQLPKRDFDLTVLDREITREEFAFLARYVKAYTLFVTEAALSGGNELIRTLIERRRGKVLSGEELDPLLSVGLLNYFPEAYGEKMRPDYLTVAQGFGGSVSWQGFEGATLTGDFGEELTQAVFWRLDLPVEQGRAIDFWLEYDKDASVEIAFEVRMIYYTYGTDPAAEKIWTFSERDMEEIVSIENKDKRLGHMFMSLKARGSGRLTITALHDRYSRRGGGTFLPGGGRRVTSDRQEVFYYFDPGNLKPPMNVYFAGYKTAEGFEGFYLMRKLGHPFLLISESRLQGGGAYMGSEEYENMLEQVIRDCMEELGFQNSQVILSGISLGSYGALYYGCRIRPHTVLIGKALASFGDIAENERIHRPGGFPTSLDMLHWFTGGLTQEAARRLNDRFWDRFDRVDWSGTQFAVAYMIEDDYDNRAYEMLQSHLKEAGTKIYGKGLHGRHNDNSQGIVDWFVDQYERILREDFGDGTDGTDGER